MFAYFEFAGKQYIAKKGDIIKNCPYVVGTEGDHVYSDTVLAMDDLVSFPEGAPIEGARVTLKILRQGELKKARIVNFRPQKRHEKWKGLRTKYTDLEVLEIHWSK